MQDMGDTNIEWTDKTWNPTRGCSRVSEGCTRCYAERHAARFAGPGELVNGIWKNAPFTGFVRKVNGHPAWTGKVELIDHMLDAPLRWRKPARVFVNSMSDLFHEALPFDDIDQVFTVMALCPKHTFQILTKRPARMLEYFNSCIHNRGKGPNRAHYYLGQNVHLGVSVEDQKTADERIPLLLQTPAAKFFVSYEPALGPVDFRWAKWQPHKPYPHVNDHYDGLRMLDQIIVGGESGPGARPFDIQLARNTIAQCKAAGVKVFVKQLGAHVIQDGERRRKKDRKGGDMSEWPHDLRVRELI